MPCSELPDNLKAFWTEAGINRSTLPVDRLRQETTRLRVEQRRAQIIVVVCMTVLAVSYGLSFCLFSNMLARLGGALTVIVCGYWMVHALMERSRTVRDPIGEDGFSFYRAELEHTRDTYRWLSWRWLLLLGPFIVFDIGVAQTYSKIWPLIVPFVALDCALVLAVFAFWLPAKNFKFARKYQDCIDTLDAASRREHI